MASRLQLQTEFETLLGTRNVYFQPPSSVQMCYPAIRYSLDDILNTHANNAVYNSKNRYSVTLIDRNPESEFVNKLNSMPLCRFVRFYTVENLNHFVFELYY